MESARIQRGGVGDSFMETQQVAGIITPGLAGRSRFVQRLRRRYAQELGLLPAGVPTRAGMEATYEGLRGRGHDTGAALRVLRQLVLERLVTLDCEQGAPLADVTQTVTALAEIAPARRPSGNSMPYTACRWLPAEAAPDSGWWAWASWARASSMSRATST